MANIKSIGTTDNYLFIYVIMMVFLMVTFMGFGKMEINGFLII